MRNPVVFFGHIKTDDPWERSFAARYMPVYDQRVQIPAGSLVIPRYSALPHYEELEEDVRLMGSELLNTHKQHKWVANFEYYDDIKQYTFETYELKKFCNWDYEGPFVVKGKTNSRKFNWSTSMFALNRRGALEMAGRLNEDPLISSQGIIIRKYEKLKMLEEGMNGLPFSNEWRFFVLDGRIVSAGYYWSIAEFLPENVPPAGATELVEKLLPALAERVRFVVVDVAEREAGGWVVVELNDGQMSGLSENDADTLYRNLWTYLKK